MRAHCFGRLRIAMWVFQRRFISCQVTVIALLMVALVAPLSSHAQSIQWPETFYNPKPAADDVILPMPCGGAMTFRKVHIPVAHVMDDYAITLGSADETWGFLESTQHTHIAGSFAATSPREGRYYLIGKYEVSMLQYAALTKPSCPQPTTQLRLPQTSISWFDALGFGDLYTQWLLTHAAKSLPLEDGVSGFLRLPTEVEWAFAARGGLQVSPSEFQERVFPMAGPMSQYVWYAGPQSSNGTLRPTGLLASNPLGLHDVLGNADEMMFDAFHMRLHGRLHGQSGGFVVRGGNYLTAQSDIRSAWRVEQPYYRDGQRNVLPTSGFRLVVVAPAVTSADRMRLLEQQWQQRGLAMGAESATPDAGGRLDALARTTENTKMKQELEQVRDQLRAANQFQREQSERAMRSSLQLGGFLCAQLNQLGREIDRREAFLAMSCKTAKPRSSPETCQSIEAVVTQTAASMKTILSLYSDTIVELGSIYPANALREQANLTSQALRARQGVNLEPYAAIYAKSLLSYIDDRRVQRQPWLEQCRAVAQ